MDKKEITYVVKRYRDWIELWEELVETDSKPDAIAIAKSVLENGNQCIVVERIKIITESEVTFD